MDVAGARTYGYLRSWHGVDPCMRGHVNRRSRVELTRGRCIRQPNLEYT